MKIYVDTNWFLSFYQSSLERPEALEKLIEYADRVVMTDQNRNEFRRNRSALIDALRKNVEKTVKVQPHTTSILMGLPEHRDVLRAARELGDATKALLGKLDPADPQSDRVGIAFNELLSKCTIIKATDDDIHRAQQRKLRGIPPSSSKRDTIGDELIWECLLRDCVEDLAIVSLDSDFLRHHALLASEFDAHQSRRRLMHVGERIVEVLTKFCGLTDEEYQEKFHEDPITRCAGCGSRAWHYAGIDRNLVHTEKLRAQFGYEPLDPATIESQRGYEKHVYVCGECNAIMLLT